MIGVFQIPTADDLEQIIDAESVTIVDFVWAAAIVTLSFLGARLLRRILRAMLRRIPALSDEAVLLISRAAGWVLILIGIVYALAIVGVDMGPALMVIIILAVVLFFAGRGIVENFAAGLVLQGAPMFAVGDEIETTSGTGAVREITGRTVVVRSPEGEEIHMPNKAVIRDPIVNLTDLGSRRSTVKLLLTYGTDLDHAKEVIERAARGCEVTHPDPPPEALVSMFADNGVEFNLLFWHEPTIMGTVRAVDAVSRSLGRTLPAEGIRFAFPQRTLWWGGEDGPSDPSDR